MKITSLIATLLTVTLLTAGFAAHAQTWSSEEAILPGPDPASAPGAFGYAVLVNPFNSTPAPGVFVGIDSAPAGTASILRLTPTDSSSSAFTQENLDGAMTSVHGLAYNSAENSLYAAGDSPWRVRKSSGHGDPGTWTDDDSFILAKSKFSSARKIAVDPSGKVFAAGVALDGRGSAPHWIVRRKLPGGTWATVFDVTGNNANMLPSVCFFPGNSYNPTPAMFTSSDLNSKWTVMRSQNLGAPGSWSQVDSWTGGGTEASPYDISCDPSTGYLYVVGCRGLNGKNPSAWVIRTSIDGGNTWKSVLDVAGAGSWASMAVVDATGKVSVSGVINPTWTATTGGKPLWKIIRCSDPQNPASWTTSFADPDTLPFGSTTYSKGRGIATDEFGNLFVTGFVRDWVDFSATPPTTYSGDRVGLMRSVP